MHPDAPQIVGISRTLAGAKRAQVHAVARRVARKHAPSRQASHVGL